MASVDFLNSEGLVDGKIPAGTECPFWVRCALLTKNCPTFNQSSIRTDTTFSCAVARSFSLLQEVVKDEIDNNRTNK
jgi:hypothetical protein